MLKQFLPPSRYQDPNSIHPLSNSNRSSHEQSINQEHDHRIRHSMGINTRAVTQHIQNNSDRAHHNPASRSPSHSGPFCVRCLMPGHLRPSCSNLIRYRACNRWGHIEKNCYYQDKPKSTSPLPTRQAQETFEQWGIGSIPAVTLIRPMVSAFNPSNQGNPTISAERHVFTTHRPTAPTSISHRPASATLLRPPSSSETTIVRPPRRETMASFPFDPTPFIPPNHQVIEVEGRPARARVVAGVVARTHEEWVIATLFRCQICR